MKVYGDIEQDNALNYLQKWFEDNRKLPNKIDRIILLRFYARSSKNIEETKKLVELHYSIRRKHPRIFLNRDPSDEDTSSTYSYFDVLALPGLTLDNCHVTLFRLSNPDPTMIHFIEDVKTTVMINDCRFSLVDAESVDNSFISEGIIVVADFNGASMRHAARLSFGTARMLSTFLHAAIPEPIKGIHLINCPSYMDKLVAVVKPFAYKEMLALLKFHTDGLESLYEHVPREILPNEYGGNAGNISELRELSKKSLLQKRDFLMDPNYWKIQSHEDDAWIINYQKP